MPALRKSPEEKAAKSAAKQEQKQQKAFEKAWRTFWDSPAGQARDAFEEGDQVFQFSIDVLNQEAIIVAMVGSRASAKHADPTSILNSVCDEGWELVNGDFVFVQEGHQSRDKFMSSGQNVAVKGTVLGYYLFKRNEANRRTDSEEDLRRRLWEPIIGAA